MIYVSMTGAKEAMQRQDVLSNNLANVNTVGFRAQLHAFRAVPLQNDSAASTRVFGTETTTGYNDAQGPMQQTGRSLDVAVQGSKSWLAFQGLDGTEAYSRAGDLTVGADGTLQTHSGLLAMGDGGPIQVPANASVQIAPDGTVNATTAGGRPTQIGRLKIVSSETPLVRGEDGLFRAQDGQPLPADENGRVVDGFLEGSNVSAVETMVNMITAARQFEAQMKMIQTAQSDGQAASKLLSMG